MPATLSSPLALDSASPERASLHSLAHSTLAAPTYQGSALPTKASMIVMWAGVATGTKATWVEKTLCKQVGSQQLVTLLFGP